MLDKMNTLYQQMLQNYEGGLSNTSTKKFDEIVASIAELLGIPEQEIYATGSGSRPGNLEVRLSQGVRATIHTTVGLGFIVDEKNNPENVAKLTNSALVTCKKFLGRGKAHYDNIVIFVESNGSISASGIICQRRTSITNKLVEELCIDNVQEVFSENVVPGTYEIRSKDILYIIALRTKPFLLLAGISGTGKSQKVQELAFMTCPKGSLREEGGTTPGNYCLVEVKPNWHDSTELLGYYSALSGKYELTDFIRFVYKATQYKDVPFFLCLDEMNLAPVEQYFAEFLSVLETRKNVGDEILTQYLLSKDRFSNCELQKKVLVKEDGDIIEGDKQYKMEFLYSEKDTEIIKYLKENGLTLPDNLFVIGTVNMDDTTHQFSRKVIDRAFTIEMNGGKMSEMFTPESRTLLEYRDDPIPLEVFKSQFVRAYEVFDDARFAKYQDVISTRIPELLGDSDGTAVVDSINGVLNDTPFRVSYRVQNELVIYLSTLIERANFPEPEQIEGLIGEATLAILLEKILPRIQGEQKQLETKKEGNTSNVLKDLTTFVERHFKPQDGSDSNSLYNSVVKKLEEMDKKLENYYTNFF